MSQPETTDVGSNDNTVQYYSEFEPFENYEDAWSSTISPNPIRIPYPSPPTTFSWPTELKICLDQLYSQQFHLRPRVYNPYFFTNGTNGHLGRESYEVYGRKLQPGNLPDWDAFFRTIQKKNINPGETTDYTQPKFATHSSFPTDKDSVVVVALFHAGPFSCGPPGLVHGGLLSSLADTLMYETVLESNRKAVTAGLNISFKSPTPINSLVWVIASVELTGERKASARCALFNQDFSQLHVEGTAVFVTPTAWVGLKEDLTYGIKNNTKFDNTKSATNEQATPKTVSTDNILESPVAKAE